VSNPLRLLISRAIVRLISDTTKLQTVQVSLLADEARAGVERFQDYGFTSVPLEGAEAIAASISGSRSNLVVLAIDDRRHRKTGMAPGEVAIYTDEGDYVVLRRGRIIEIKAGGEVIIDAPQARCTGGLHVAGPITCDSDIADAKGTMQEMRETYNPHTHNETGTVTSPPSKEMA
jgi:phage baseplate assembly protein V